MFRGYMNIAVLGSGAREFALLKRLSKDKLQNDKIYCISKTENVGAKKLGIITLLFSKVDEIIDLLIRNKINIVIPGGENFLIGDLCSECLNKGIMFFGPSKNAALLETDKLFCRNLFNNSKYKEFNPKFIKVTNDDLDILNVLLESYPVIKPTGLCGGKGVKIYNIDFKTKEDSINYIVGCLKKNETVLLEELLEGPEFSFQSIVSGETIYHSFPIMDFKRLKDNNEGQNTGSMGCISQHDGLLPEINSEDVKQAEFLNESALELILNHIKYKSNETYKGFIYGSYIKTSNGIKIIEYNARLGDPEAIPFINSIKTNFRELIVNASYLNHLSNPQFEPMTSINLYLVPQNYPNRLPCYLENLINISRLSLNELNNIYYSDLKETDKNLIYQLGTSRSLVITVKNINELNKITSKIFGDVTYRTDIGNIFQNNKKSNSFNYKNSGVDVENANKIVENIGEQILKTQKINHPIGSVISKIGDFSGLVEFKNSDTVLVSSIDGVGTKSSFTPMVLKDKHLFAYENLGRDIVNHSVNDTLVKGAKPLMFLDYIASSKLDNEIVASIVKGMTDECLKNECFLIGGETAEMPGTYTDNSYDIVGVIIGTIKKENIIDYSRIKPHMKVYGIRSSSPHTNGYSSIRKLYNNDDKFRQYLEVNLDFKEWITAPHRCYLPELQNLIENKQVCGLCHITGGGYKDNLKRILPSNIGIELQKDAIFSNYFRVLQRFLNISDEDMMTTYNCGIGMVVFVDETTNLSNNDDFVEIGNTFNVDSNQKDKFIFN